MLSADSRRGGFFCTVLIINSDDLGRDQVATDSTLACYHAGRISSASAMVFMRDSERAARESAQCGIELGLHLNFTELFSDPNCPSEIVASQRRIRSHLKKHKYAFLIYHPFLKKDFRNLIEAQLSEFKRVYRREPAFFDGHQHMHLATNVLAHNLIPSGKRVRRSFTFKPEEKSAVNRGYRSIVDRVLKKRHLVTDSFYALSTQLDQGTVEEVLRTARAQIVELMTHTWVPREYDFLTSEGFATALQKAGLRKEGRLWTA